METLSARFLWHVLCYFVLQTYAVETGRIESVFHALYLMRRRIIFHRFTRGPSGINDWWHRQEANDWPEGVSFHVARASWPPFRRVRRPPELQPELQLPVQLAGVALPRPHVSGTPGRRPFRGADGRRGDGESPGLRGVWCGRNQSRK